MKRLTYGITCCFLLSAGVLCTGCWQRSFAAGESSSTEIPCAGGVDGRSLSSAGESGLDSIVCVEGCTEYTCYFTRGTRNKKALEHIQAVIFGNDVIDVNFDDDPRSIDRYRTHYLDSLSSLEWLEYEPWVSIRSLFMKWSKQQLDRYYIVSMANRDPAILYHCSETDSVLVRCAEIISQGGNGYVDAVRQLWRENEYAKAARDSTAFDRSYMELTLARIDRVLGEQDSLENARKHLFVLLSNHINHKIHNRLGENGTVDFYRYTEDFLRIFDRVRVEMEEP